MIEKAAKEYSKEPTKEEKLEKATLDELDELEDDEDDDILQKYRSIELVGLIALVWELNYLSFRQKRIEEMKTQALRNRYGFISEIKAPEWKAEVTNAPEDVHVIVHLYKPGIPACQLVNNCLVKLANKVCGLGFLKLLIECVSFSSKMSNSSAQSLMRQFRITRTRTFPHYSSTKRVIFNARYSSFFLLLSLD